MQLQKDILQQTPKWIWIKIIIFFIVMNTFSSDTCILILLKFYCGYKHIFPVSKFLGPFTVICLSFTFVNRYSIHVKFAKDLIF